MVLNALTNSLPSEQATRMVVLFSNLSSVWDEVDKEWLKSDDSNLPPDTIRPREKTFSKNPNKPSNSADARVSVMNMKNNQGDMMNNLMGANSSASNQPLISAFQYPTNKSQAFNSIKSRLDAVLSLSKTSRVFGGFNKNKSQSVFAKF